MIESLTGVAWEGANTRQSEDYAPQTSAGVGQSSDVGNPTTSGEALTVAGQRRICTELPLQKN